MVGLVKYLLFLRSSDLIMIMIKKFGLCLGERGIGEGKGRGICRSRKEVREEEGGRGKEKGAREESERGMGREGRRKIENGIVGGERS